MLLNDASVVAVTPESVISTKVSDAVDRISCEVEIVNTLPAKLATIPFALAKVVFCKTPLAALIKPLSDPIVIPANIGVAVVRLSGAVEIVRIFVANTAVTPLLDASVVD